MRPYNWIPKYSNVFELKHDSTIGNKKAARQYAKKNIKKELEYYEYYFMPFYERPWDFEDYQEIKIAL